MWLVDGILLSLALVPYGVLRDVFGVLFDIVIDGTLESMLADGLASGLPTLLVGLRGLGETLKLLLLLMADSRRDLRTEGFDGVSRLRLDLEDAGLGETPGRHAILGAGLTDVGVRTGRGSASDWRALLLANLLLGVLLLL